MYTYIYIYIYIYIFHWFYILPHTSNACGAKSSASQPNSSWPWPLMKITPITIGFMVDISSKWGPRSRVRSVGEHNDCFTRVDWVVRTIDYRWGYKPTNITFGGPTLMIWRFPKIEVPLVIIHFWDWDFPWNKPSSYWGTKAMETPKKIYLLTLEIAEMIRTTSML